MFGSKQTEEVVAQQYVVRTVANKDREVQRLLNEYHAQGWAVQAIYPIVSGVMSGATTTVQVVFVKKDEHPTFRGMVG
jgi:hypothetical protein